MSVDEQSQSTAEEAEELVEEGAQAPEAEEAPEAPEAEAPVEDLPATPSIRQRLAGRRWAVALAAAVLVSAVVAGSVFWWVWRPDQLTDDSSRDQVLGVAREATEVLLSYSPENIDKNVEDAKSRLTGDFLERYSQFASTVVIPAAKQRGVKTEANVARLAVSQMSPDSAHVLAFVNQVTTSKERPTPALATSSVMMTLVRVDGHWLVSEFNPI